MALIIPEAQTQASPVELPRLNPNAPTGAEGIAALADAGIAIRASKVKAQQDRMLRGARLDAINQLDQARQTYEQTGDMNNLAARWEADAKAITETIASGLPKHLRADFTMAITEIVQPQTSAIRRREFALFRDHETAALNGDLRGYANAAAAAPDEEARRAIYADAASAIGAAQDAGLISAVEADRMMQDIPANTERIEALRLTDEDPQALLDLFEQGGGAFLPPEERARYTAVAKSNLASQAARTAKEAELAAEVADKELGTRTDTAIEILRTGKPYAGLSQLLQDTAGTPHGDRLRAEIDATAATAAFALMTPAEQEAELARQRATATDNLTTAKAMGRMETIARATRDSLAADPLAHVRDRGILPLAPVDIADPASVQRRRAEAETVFRDFTPDAPAIHYLDKAEAERLSAIVKGPDVDQALSVLVSVTENFGPAAGPVLAQIGADDRLSYMAGALVSETGDIGAARTLLRGRAMARDGKGARVAAEVSRAVTAEMAAVFPTSADPRLAALTEAAAAHYAASGMAVADPKSEEAKTAFRASMQAVTGQRSIGGVTYGGIQEVNGQRALLPPKLTARQVEQALIHFGPDSWKRASTSGNLPRGFENYQTGHRENWTIMAARDGTYLLGYRQRSGDITYLQDPGQKDGFFHFDLADLVTGRGQ